ncbi:MAG: response regulator [Candidatus Zixiibacteriota bacterium]
MHRVFIVDDEAEIVEIMVEYFESEEFEALGSSNPQHALESIARNQPEIVLMDIMMPEIDGYELARRLKSDSRTAAIPIIFLSGKERQEDNLQFSKCSGELFVHKPVVLQDLKASILLMLDSDLQAGQ